MFFNSQSLRNEILKLIMLWCTLQFTNCSWCHVLFDIILNMLHVLGHVFAKFAMKGISVAVIFELKWVKRHFLKG